MKRLAKNMLIISIFCLALSNITGCASKIPVEDRIEITDVQKFKKCPAPDKPVYGAFNNELHAGHLGNLEMMRLNLELALKYNDRLENTLDCYVKQTEKPNE